MKAVAIPSDADKEIVRVAVSVRHDRTSCRRTCEGIAEYARERRNWRLKMIEPDEIFSADLSIYDGFIWDVYDKKVAKQITKYNRPVIDMTNEGIYEGTLGVIGDHRPCGQLAVRHFLSRHLKNFAFCGWENMNFSDARKESFCRALKLHHYECDVFLSKKINLEIFARDIVSRLFYPDDAEEIASWLKSLPKPVGIFCANDLRAWQLVEVCTHYGIDVPREVAILGADNDTLPCLFSSVPISSIYIGSSVGYYAAKTLDELMSGERDMKSGNVFVGPACIETRLSSETYPLEPPWMPKALSFIHSRVAQSVTVSDVAEHVGLSVSTVSNVFRSVLNTTVQNEIAKTRLDEAEHLLANTTYTLKEIALRSGFNSQQYFSNCFTGHFGVSPAAWRERNQKRR